MLIIYRELGVSLLRKEKVELQRIFIISVEIQGFQVNSQIVSGKPEGEYKMPLYKYKVIDSKGTARDGELTADNEEKLLDNLRKKGYTVIDVSEAGEEDEKVEDTLTRDVGFSLEFGVSQKNLSFFTRQLAITLKAGLPLSRIITTLYKQTSSKNLKKILHDVGKDIQLGLSFSEAMNKHEDVFDSMYRSMISVGEASGTLPESVEKLANMMERDQAVKRRVKSALAYPIFIISFSVILSYVLIAMLMPGFTPIFKSTGMDIQNEYPLTYTLMQASDFVTNPVVVGVTIGLLVILIIVVQLMKRSKRGRYIVDYVKFNFPFVGSMIRTAAVTRYCKSFATLTKSGVPLLKSMSLVAGASGNSVVARAVEKMSKEIREGERMSVVMKRAKIFPELVVQMVSIGEEAGNISEMLDRTSEYFEQELESAIESMTSVMEPAMMILVGLIVGVFVMGILLPILGIASKFGG